MISYTNSDNLFNLITNMGKPSTTYAEFEDLDKSTFEESDDFDEFFED
jgi:hypothetical protein